MPAASLPTEPSQICERPAERARAGWDDISTPDALKAALHPPSAAELKALGYVATPTGCALMRYAA